ALLAALFLWAAYSAEQALLFCHGREDLHYTPTRFIAARGSPLPTGLIPPGVWAAAALPEPPRIARAARVGRPTWGAADPSCAATQIGVARISELGLAC